MVGILVPETKKWMGAQHLANSLCEKGVDAVRTWGSEPHQVLIRWGCSARRGCSGMELEYNPVEAIVLAAQKLDALHAMAEAGVPTMSTMSAEEAMECGDFPLIARKGLHYRGKGFWLCLQGQDVINSIVDGADYWMPFIPIEREWRVNTFIDDEVDMSRTLCYEKRPPVESACSRGTRLPMWQWVRNSKNGWTFHRDDEPSDELRSIAKSAVRAMGLNIGGVDVALSNGNYFVIEVNTAPGIGPSCTAPWFANRIINALKRRGMLDE